MRRISLWLLVFLVAATWPSKVLACDNTNIQEIINLIGNKGFKPVDNNLIHVLNSIKQQPIDDTDKMLNAVLFKYDKYSYYYSPEECQKIISGNEGFKDGITAQFIDSKTCCIKISAFTIGTDDKFIKILNDMDAGNITHLVLDLRDCSGGLTGVMLNIADYLVPKGVIYTAHYKNFEKTFYSSLDHCKYKITVLVNQNTASAAEILSAALQESKAGIVIGERTYGKASIQELIPLTNGGILKLTVGYYTTRNGVNLNGIGVGHYLSKH